MKYCIFGFIGRQITFFCLLILSNYAVVYTRTGLLYNISPLTVGATPLDVSASQIDPTSARVSWTPPDPIGQTIGYQIYYAGPTSGNVSVDGVELNSLTVSGLVNGELYNFSVAGRSQHFESEPLPAGRNPVGFCKLPSYSSNIH